MPITVKPGGRKLNLKFKDKINLKQKFVLNKCLLQKRVETGNNKKKKKKVQE